MKKPVNEMGVVSLFAQYSQGLGYVIMEIQAAFPDALVYEIATGKMLRVELEFRAKNFKLHGHDPQGCDLVVCWENNWPECPIPVLPLDKCHTQEPVETVYELTERAKALAEQVDKSQEIVDGATERAAMIVSKGVDLARERVNQALARTGKRAMAISKTEARYSEEGRVPYAIMRCLKCKKALRPVYLDSNRKAFVFSEGKDVKMYWGKILCDCGKEREFTPTNVTVRRAAVVERTEQI